jgi:hypothetical protein
MQTVLLVLVSVMGLASVGMMFVAMIEFILYLRQSREQEAAKAVAPVAVQEVKAEPVLVAEPAPVAEPVPAEEPKTVAQEPVAEQEENNVSFEVSETQRQTLLEAYEALNKTSKGYYDKILAAARSLELARIIESTYAITVMQGRDTIARLRIMRGAVTLDCTVINPDLVKYNKENGKKIRSRPTRFRVTSKDELDAAIYTMNVANQTSLDNRNVKKKTEEKEV